MFHEDDDGDDDDDDDYYCSSARGLGLENQDQISCVSGKLYNVIQSQFTVGKILNETRTSMEVGTLRHVKTFALSCEY